MTIETDATRLAMIKMVGGEEFDAGYTSSLWGVFSREYLESSVGAQTVENRNPVLEIRTSDVATHSLVKESVLRRKVDDSLFRVKRFEDDGTGMTVVVLRG